MLPDIVLAILHYVSTSAAICHLSYNVMPLQAWHKSHMQQHNHVGLDCTTSAACECPAVQAPEQGRNATGSMAVTVEEQTHISEAFHEAQHILLSFQFLVYGHPGARQLLDKTLG